MEEKKFDFIEASVEDKKKIDEALGVLELLTDSYPHISASQWGSAFFSIVVGGYKNSGYDFNEIRTLINRGIDFYEKNWKD